MQITPSSYYGGHHHQSDNGPAFISKITPQVPSLGITWKLHIPSRPQSSGKVERVNGLTRDHLTKLSTELRKSCVELLPLALMHLRATPCGPLFLSPLERMYCRPPLTNHELPIQSTLLAGYFSYFSLLRQLLQEHTDRCLPQPVPPSPDAPVNLLCPGDQVLLKAISPKPLPPKWMGPHTIILTTPTAVKVLSNMSWHQLSRVKPVPVDKQYVCECWAQLSLLEATQIRSTSLTQPWPQALKQVPARRLAGNPRLTLTRVVGAGLAETLHPLPRSRAPSSSRSPRRLILTSCGRSPSSTPYGGVR
ncbi:uncharacterized protein LOC129146228 isoform X1 [Talpa occidentalis]|uniref:uncharacterized protein LOC129146228 isoform X1 n=1 Tax=Talpa occidentalis TaxID=50954 RepID=UPI0023F71D95|nr:uncharacterized protein LOC129146228 isoform X1 [Talpa occidentalis]